MTGVPATVSVLRWAAERVRLTDAELEARFPKWPLWLSGEAMPTLRQLEEFARLTHTSFGYFFLPEPPALPLPVPDYRTFRDIDLRDPSTELLDTIFLCEQRQEWFRDYAQMQGMQPLPFVGSVSVADRPVDVARKIREELSLSMEERAALSTWTDALRQLMARMEAAGILVMSSSIVGSNSHRQLDVEEFRGFVLTDRLAPLVFLNAADSKAAQMFTLAHELAHVWVGQSGVTDPDAGRVPAAAMERWCNEVAAELLVPESVLREAHEPSLPLQDEMARLAKTFKVSTLVVLRRLFDAGMIDQATLVRSYREEAERFRSLEKDQKAKGGDYYRTMGVRTGKRFSRAVLASALEGQTLFRDAFRLLGMRKSATFFKAARELGVMP